MARSDLGVLSHYILQNVCWGVMQEWLQSWQVNDFLEDIFQS